MRFCPKYPKKILYYLILSLICEASFLFLISWNSSSLLTKEPEMKFSEMKRSDLVQYIVTECPHFGEADLKKALEQAQMCFREKRSMGERALAFNPYELSEKKLCQQLLRYCRDKPEMESCPGGKKETKIRRLEECFFGFIPIKRFREAKLESIRKKWVRASAIGVAVFIYACEPNPFLYTIWTEHFNNGIPFVILCPRHNHTHHPAIQVISAFGPTLDIGWLSPKETIDRQLKLEMAERLEVVLAMVSDPSVGMIRVITALTTVPICFFWVISGWALTVSVFTGRAFTVLMLLLSFFAPTFLPYLLQGNAAMALRILWLFPMNSLIRLEASPWFYIILYFIYSFLFVNLSTYFFKGLEYKTKMEILFEQLLDPSMFNEAYPNILIIFGNPNQSSRKSTNTTDEQPNRATGANKRKRR